MSGTWWTKVVIIICAVMWGIWALLPTILGKSAEEMLRAQAADVEAVAGGGSGASEAEAVSELEPAWWASLLSEARINLGLDLQGGIDLTLHVEVEEAVISSVHRDIKSVKESAEQDGLALIDVRREQGQPTLLIQGGEGVGLSDVVGFMQAKYPIYEYENTRTIDGFKFLAFPIMERESERIASSAVQQAVETLRSRIDETGVKEPAIVLKGGNRINVQLPGMENVQQAIKAIGTTAVLDFMMVEETVMKGAGDLEKALYLGEESLDDATFLDDEAFSDWMIREKHIPSGTRLLWEYRTSPEGLVRDTYYVVKDEIIITGDDINDAVVSWNQYNEPYVAIEFKNRGAKVFCDVTSENVGRRFAIVLDKKARSAPVIRERICGGRASIEMGVGDYNMAQEEASVLALVLRTGALPAPVTPGEVRTVGASLGADAIRSGRSATFVGFSLVLMFMLVYYRKSGIISVAALCLNILFVMALLATAGATLTLPGIAGIALTVGMAVDCNIIIYERIREELRLGKNSRAAADAGFEKALWAVLDANITTFIAGVVLYTYGTGPIKGFAVTLMIGIITTLFTGIFISRTMMELLTRRTQQRLSI